MAARAAIAFVALAAGTGAWALDTAQWPPPEAQQARMRELQQAIVDPKSTPAQRDAARSALADLLRSPAGQGHGLEAKPPRAAVEPSPPIVKPLPGEPSVPGVATLRPVEPSSPPKPAVDPRTGVVLPPGGRTAVDPLTGHVLHEVAGGYVDPATGRFIPR